MCAVVIEETIRIPEWVKDLPSFRRWAHSVEFPHSGRISYLNGEVWVDKSPERLFNHNLVKTEFISVLGSLAKKSRLGKLFSDRTLITNVAAGLSTEPEMLFVSHESIRADRVRFVESAAGDYIEIEGSPDMVLEIVSPTSVVKDTKRLPVLYARAEIAEYWLVDARKEPVQFTIYQLRTNREYSKGRNRDGWIKSQVFGKSFKLTVAKDQFGYREYTLHVG